VPELEYGVIEDEEWIADDGEEDAEIEEERDEDGVYEDVEAEDEDGMPVG